MGKIGTCAVFPLIFAAMFLSLDASSRSLLSGDKAGPSPSPNENYSEKGNFPASAPPPPNQVDQKSSPEETNNAKKQGANSSPSNPAPPPNSGPSNPTPNPNTTPSQTENCEVHIGRCIKGTLVACLQLSQDEPEKYILLVQNIGENSLNVTIKGTSPLKFDTETMPLSKRSSNKILIPKNEWDGTKIVLNAGEGDCTLQAKRQFLANRQWTQWTQWIAALTPVYGAYILVFAMVLAAGIWACCKYTRGKRHDAGVPYQQLEMGARPQSGSVTEVGNTGVSWDEGWDDDWDEEAVTKSESPTNSLEIHPDRGVSSNGLTSKAQNKDGWDVDWDD